MIEDREKVPCAMPPPSFDPNCKRHDFKYAKESPRGQKEDFSRQTAETQATPGDRHEFGQMTNIEKDETEYDEGGHSLRSSTIRLQHLRCLE